MIFKIRLILIELRCIDTVKLLIADSRLAARSVVTEAVIAAVFEIIIELVFSLLCAVQITRKTAKTMSIKSTSAQFSRFTCVRLALFHFLSGPAKGHARVII